MEVPLDLQAEVARSEWKTSDGNFRTKVSYRRRDNLQAFQKDIEQGEEVVFLWILHSSNEMLAQ